MYVCQKNVIHQTRCQFIYIWHLIHMPSLKLSTADSHVDLFYWQSSWNCLQLYSCSFIHIWKNFEVIWLKTMNAMFNSIWENERSIVMTAKRFWWLVRFRYKVHQHKTAIFSSEVCIETIAVRTKAIKK